MSEKRRDNKNRVLRTGESQKKDGRYMYKYTDSNGKIKYVYSCKLVATDTVPQGARDDIALRDKIKAIQRDLSDGIVSDGGNMTVYNLVKKYTAQKTGVKPSTKAGYGTVLNILEKEDFGRERIDKIKMSDAKAWLIKLQADGRSYSSIHTIRGVVRPAFQMAVNDDLIRKSPFEFPLLNVIVNDSAIREALTPQQERKLLEFLKTDNYFNRYYDAIYILLNTGLRISEFTGLTMDDVDMDNDVIYVRHQLQRTSDMEYIVQTTKTVSGSRQIPMINDVKECFKRIIEKRKPPKAEPIINGVKGFLYLDDDEMPKVALHWEKYFNHICEKHNKIYKEELPNVTPHICRHTFATNMARSGMNPKALQILMGHADISTTLNIYTHLGFEDVQKEMLKISELQS